MTGTRVAIDPDLHPRVLLVDDRPDNLLALRAVLDPLGLELVEASSGEEALRRLLGPGGPGGVPLEDEFALIVLDVQMPVLDGFETARLIKGRERTRHVPIIFLTAISGEPEHYLRGYESGAVDYVYKPFEPEILRAKVAVFAELWARGATIERQQAELTARLAELDRANEALARQAIDLERSNTALERFAEAASTEIREPLFTVAGLLDLLADRHGQSLTEEGALLVERAAAGTGRTVDIVDDLLHYARVTATDVRREPVPLGEALARAEAELRPKLEAAGAAVVSGTLPTVSGDPFQITRIFAALIDNALKFRGEAPPEVRVWGVRSETGWRVAVADNGRGIDPAELPRLFTVFRAGQGLGLAVCRRIVERHGGLVWAEPGEDGGTTVWFELADVEGGA
jgi:signal transduction histidine kinase